MDSHQRFKMVKFGIFAVLVILTFSKFGIAQNVEVAKDNYLFYFKMSDCNSTNTTTLAENDFLGDFFTAACNRSSKTEDDKIAEQDFKALSSFERFTQKVEENQTTTYTSITNTQIVYTSGSNDSGKDVIRLKKSEDNLPLDLVHAHVFLRRSMNPKKPQDYVALSGYIYTMDTNKSTEWDIVHRGWNNPNGSFAFQFVPYPVSEENQIQGRGLDGGTTTTTTNNNINIVAPTTTNNVVNNNNGGMNPYMMMMMMNQLKQPSGQSSGYNNNGNQQNYGNQQYGQNQYGQQQYRQQQNNNWNNNNQQQGNYGQQGYNNNNNQYQPQQNQGYNNNQYGGQGGGGGGGGGGNGPDDDYEYEDEEEEDDPNRGGRSRAKGKFKGRKSKNGDYDDDEGPKRRRKKGRKSTASKDQDVDNKDKDKEEQQRVLKGLKLEIKNDYENMTESERKKFCDSERKKLRKKKKQQENQDKDKREAIFDPVEDDFDDSLVTRIVRKDKGNQFNIHLNNVMCLEVRRRRKRDSEGSKTTASGNKPFDGMNNCDDEGGSKIDLSDLTTTGKNALVEHILKVLRAQCVENAKDAALDLFSADLVTLSKKSVDINAKNPLLQRKILTESELNALMSAHFFHAFVNAYLERKNAIESNSTESAAVGPTGDEISQTVGTLTLMIQKVVDTFKNTGKRHIYQLASNLRTIINIKFLGTSIKDNALGQEKTCDDKCKKDTQINQNDRIQLWALNEFLRLANIPLILKASSAKSAFEETYKSKRDAIKPLAQEKGVVLDTLSM